MQEPTETVEPKRKDSLKKPTDTSVPKRRENDTEVNYLNTKLHIKNK